MTVCPCRHSAPRASLLHLLFLALGIALHPTGAAAVRVAILAEPGAEAAGELLTASLSSVPDIELVERDILAGIVRERRLTEGGFVAESSRILGSMVGAQMVVALSKEEAPRDRVGINGMARSPPDSGGAMLARVFIAGPGVLLGFARAGNPEDLAAVALRQIRNGLESRGEWTPVSVLNVRFEIGEEDAATIEKNLTQLLVGWLAAQPGMAVLERTQLLQAAFEKSLDRTNTDFWAGAYLVEAQLQREGALLRARPRLKPPSGRAPVVLPAVEFPAGNPDEGARRIALAVAEAIGVRGRRETEWKHSEEAGVLFQEARWCFRHHRIREALQLAETSLALGKNDFELLSLRVRAESSLALPGLSRPIPDLRAPLRPEEIPAALEHGKRALQVFLDGHELRTVQTGNWQEEDVRILAWTAAASVSPALASVFRHNSQTMFADSVAEIRSLIRKVRERILVPELTRPDNIADMNRMGAWFSLEALYAGVWFETEDAACSAFRNLLRYPINNGQYGGIRRAFGTYDPRSMFPVFPSPDTEDGHRTRWLRFSQSLQRESDPRLHLDGLVIEYLLTRDRAEKAKIGNLAMDALMGMADQLFKEKLFVAYSDLLRSQISPPRESINPLLISLIAIVLEKSASPFEFDKLLIGQRGSSLREQGYRQLNEAQAKQVLPPLQRFRKRFPSSELAIEWEAHIQERFPTLQSTAPYTVMDARSIHSVIPLPRVSGPMRPALTSPNSALFSFLLTENGIKRTVLMAWRPSDHALRTVFTAEQPIEGDLCGEGNRVYFVRNPSAVCVDLSARPVRATEIPIDPPIPGEIRAKIVMDGILYVSCVIESARETAMFSVNLKTGKREILASSRRAPAQNFLDDREMMFIESLYRGPDSNLWTRSNPPCRYNIVQKAWDTPFGVIPMVLQKRFGSSALFMMNSGHAWTCEDGPGPATWIMKNPKPPGTGWLGPWMGNKFQNEPAFPVGMTPATDIPRMSEPKEWTGDYRVLYSAYDGTRLWFMNRSPLGAWMPSMHSREDKTPLLHILHSWNLSSGQHTQKKVRLVPEPNPAGPTKFSAPETESDLPINEPEFSVFTSGILIHDHPMMWIPMEDWEK